MRYKTLKYSLQWTLLSLNVIFGNFFVYSLASEVVCPKGSLLCDEDKCIEESDICDSIPHCDDDRDELGCECLLFGWGVCLQDRECYTPHQHCDSNLDCADGSDERDCPIKEKIMSTTEVQITSTENSITPTEAPISSTETPITSTEAPITSTEAPIISTEAPITSTVAPLTSIEAQITSTEASITNAEYSITSTEISITPTEASITSTEIPITSTEIPITSTGTPITSTGTPISFTGTPISSTEAPITSTEAPITSTEAPITSTEASFTSTNAPVTSNEAPFTSPEASIASTDPLITLTEAPTTFTEALITSTDDPVTFTEAPKTSTNAPINTSVDPITTKDAPITSTKAPTASTEAHCFPAGITPVSHRNLNASSNCKRFVTGPNCDECVSGTFRLHKNNVEGCQECFCMNTNSTCVPSNRKRKKMPVKLDKVEGDEVSRRTGKKVLSFKLPKNLLGDRISSYGGAITFYANDVRLNFTATLTLKGNGLELQQRRRNDIKKKYLLFKFNESRWKKRLKNHKHKATRAEILTVLANVEDIKLETSQQENQKKLAFNSLSLDYAIHASKSNKVAPEIEECDCPKGYRGSSCQHCALGYRKVKHSFDEQNRFHFQCERMIKIIFTFNDTKIFDLISFIIYLDN